MPVALKIGADPEVFLKDKTGKIISAHDKMPGTKEKPYVVTKGAIQVDGLAAEFNIDPAETASMFSKNIKIVMDQLKSHVGNDVELSIQPTAMFEEGYFKSLPELTRTLGCVPDFNAWTGQANKAPDSNAFQRAAGGHIHLGWGSGMNPEDNIHIDDCRKVAQQLDYYVGMYSLMWDKDTERRKMYGKAGCFRPKSYGMEYRTLSNAWLATPQLQEWVFNAAFKAFHDLIQGKSAEEKFGDICIDIINNSEDWTTKKIGLSGFTDLIPPPVPKKPRDPSAPKLTSAQIKAALTKSYNYSAYMTDIYYNAAEGATSESAKEVCNKAILKHYDIANYY